MAKNKKVFLFTTTTDENGRWMCKLVYDGLTKDFFEDSAVHAIMCMVALKREGYKCKYVSSEKN